MTEAMRSTNCPAGKNRRGARHEYGYAIATGKKDYQKERAMTIRELRQAYLDGATIGELAKLRNCRR